MEGEGIIMGRGGGSKGEINRMEGGEAGMQWKRKEEQTE